MPKVNDILMGRFGKNVQMYMPFDQIINFKYALGMKDMVGYLYDHKYQPRPGDGELGTHVCYDNPDVRATFCIEDAMLFNSPDQIRQFITFCLAGNSPLPEYFSTIIEVRKCYQITRSKEKING